VVDMSAAIEFHLNGKLVRLETDPGRLLLWVLRTDCGLTGTKFGCGIGLCGACTVLVQDNAVRSCMYPLGLVAGKAVTTIEGLANGTELHPLQQAFVEHDALQCGFCTPGMILNAHALLRRQANPTKAEVVREMDDHLCRCGAHPRIVDAILDAANRMRGGSQ
jgi:aerobic-type carbon monoxide dehydrogenase small subunit (CoxS/CutS family)